MIYDSAIGSQMPSLERKLQLPTEATDNICFFKTNEGNGSCLLLKIELCKFAFHLNKTICNQHYFIRTPDFAGFS